MVLSRRSGLPSRRVALLVTAHRVKATLRAMRGIVIMPDALESRQHAVDILGNTGELVRIPAIAEVYPSASDADQWIVWAVDTDGAMVETVFAGPSAERRAIVYAQANFAGLERRGPRPRQYR